MTRWALVLVLAAVTACGDSAGPGANRPERGIAMSELPLCKSGADLARLDGQRVRVVGIYRRELVARKQGEAPSLFLGQVRIELEGRTTDYDASRWDEPASVSLGAAARTDAEVQQLTDQRVTVEGRLVLRPKPADPDAASERLPPTLFELSGLRAAK